MREIARTRAAAFIVKNGAVLLQRKRADTVWALPGGRVEEGETPEMAVRRELLEELGEPVICGELVRVVKNHFTLANDLYRELGYYFEVEFPSSSIVPTLPGVFPGKELSVELEFKWFSEKELDAIEFRPKVLKSSLLSESRRFEELVQEL